MVAVKYSQISISYSDGTSSAWPQNTTKRVLADGTYEYFRPVEHGESKDVLWRSKTATALVEQYAPPDKPVSGNFIFRSLPENYKLYEHVKGKPDGVRKDTYLFGHPTGRRFRSPAEFLPHLFHLASHIPQNAGPTADQHRVCSCRCCRPDTRGSGGGGSTPQAGAGRKAPSAKDDALAARKETQSTERLSEQETVGWLLRKGEIAWTWLPADAADDGEPCASDDDERGQWAAGLVTSRPTVNTPHRKPPQPTGSVFADIDMDDTPTWQSAAVSEADRTYRVQLLDSDEVRERVPQHFVRPWLARPHHAASPQQPHEHPSVAAAREAAQTFTFFERRPGGSSTPEEQTSDFGGVFLGAEKIFAGEPVRIASPSNTNDDDADDEDVLVVSRMYTVSRPSSTQPGKKKTNALFQGSVYTTRPDAAPLTPELFAQLPFRMRRGDGSGEIIKWYIRNNPAVERGEISMRMVLGRWYEPMAVHEWLRDYHHPHHPHPRGPGAHAQLGHARVTTFQPVRAHVLGLDAVDGIQLDPERRPPVAILANPAAAHIVDPVSNAPRAAGTTIDDPMEIDEDDDAARYRPVTPERRFQSVNLPVSTPRPRLSAAASSSSSSSSPQPPPPLQRSASGKSKMAMAVEGDDEDDEDDAYEDEGGQEDEMEEGMDDDDDDDDDDEGVLGRSPTKRRSDFAIF